MPTHQTHIPDQYLVTIGAAAKRLNLRRHQLEYRLSNGLLPDAPRVGGRRVFNEALLLQYAVLLESDLKPQG